MRELVWGNTYEDGRTMLESVKNDYLLSGYEIAEEVNNKSSNYIIFNNGDVWKAVSPRDSARGNKANISYVDSRITDVGCFINDKSLYNNKTLECYQNYIWSLIYGI